MVGCGVMVPLPATASISSYVSSRGPASLSVAVGISRLALDILQFPCAAYRLFNFLERERVRDRGLRLYGRIATTPTTGNHLDLLLCQFPRFPAVFRRGRHFLSDARH